MGTGEAMAEIPPPGLQGDWSDTCIACFRATDTGLPIRGEAEAHIAALMVFGVPRDQTDTIIRALTDAPPGEVFAGVREIPYRVCAWCAGRGHLKVALAVGPLPSYSPPGE